MAAGRQESYAYNPSARSSTWSDRSLESFAHTVFRWREVTIVHSFYARIERRVRKKSGTHSALCVPCVFQSPLDPNLLLAYSGPRGPCTKLACFSLLRLACLLCDPQTPEYSCPCSKSSVRRGQCMAKLRQSALIAQDGAWAGVLVGKKGGALHICFVRPMTVVICQWVSSWPGRDALLR